VQKDPWLFLSYRFRLARLELYPDKANMPAAISSCSKRHSYWALTKQGMVVFIQVCSKSVVAQRASTHHRKLPVYSIFMWL
jgi:hypothetical protein